ncbi:hypothetical protein [Arthrobacter sp. 7Tela_A1]|uniref:hypothetical protein n=1 Tax=Arthrobacter sp. 7Tela_A1 TaxID=3093745 RepID=UPI003BB618FE
MDTDEVTRSRCEAITAGAAAGIAGVGDPALGRKWAAGGALTPAQPGQQRLHFACGLMNEIDTSQDQDTARTWILCSNPRLGYDSSVKEIREDRFREAARRRL